MGRRVEAVGDPWQSLHSHAQLLRAPLERVEALLTPRDWEESLAAATRRAKPRKR